MSNDPSRPPKTRADCIKGPRPCPAIRCKYHLISAMSRQKTYCLADLKETCVLDVADRGHHTLEQIGEVLDVTRERVRQLEEQGLAHLKEAIEASGMKEEDVIIQYAVGYLEEDGSNYGRITVRSCHDPEPQPLCKQVSMGVVPKHVIKPRPLPASLEPFRRTLTGNSKMPKRIEEPQEPEPDDETTVELDFDDEVMPQEFDLTANDEEALIDNDRVPDPCRDSPTDETKADEHHDEDPEETKMTMQQKLERLNEIDRKIAALTQERESLLSELLVDPEFRTMALSLSKEGPQHWSPSRHFNRRGEGRSRNERIVTYMRTKVHQTLSPSEIAAAIGETDVTKVRGSLVKLANRKNSGVIRVERGLYTVRP